MPLKNLENIQESTRNNSPDSWFNSTRDIWFTIQFFPHNIFKTKLNKFYSRKTHDFIFLFFIKLNISFYIKKNLLLFHFFHTQQLFTNLSARYSKVSLPGRVAFSWISCIRIRVIAPSAFSTTQLMWEKKTDYTAWYSNNFCYFAVPLFPQIVINLYRNLSSHDYFIIPHLLENKNPLMEKCEQD